MEAIRPVLIPDLVEEAQQRSDAWMRAGARMWMFRPELASATARNTFVNRGMGSVDPLIQKALLNVLKRKDYIKTLSSRQKPPWGG